MKKHLKSFAVWLCIAVLLCSLTSCVKPSGPTPTVDNIPPSTSLSTPKPSPPAEQQPASDERYRMDISVDGMSVRVRQAVTYRNTSGKELGELKMHLYANAYRSYELVFDGRGIRGHTAFEYRGSPRYCCQQAGEHTAGAGFRRSQRKTLGR